MTHVSLKRRQSRATYYIVYRDGLVGAVCSSASKILRWDTGGKWGRGRRGAAGGERKIHKGTMRDYRSVGGRGGRSSSPRTDRSSSPCPPGRTGTPLGARPSRIPWDRRVHAVLPSPEARARDHRASKDTIDTGVNVARGTPPTVSGDTRSFRVPPPGDAPPRS